MVFNNKSFNVKDGVVDFNVRDSVSMKVGKFYEETPFPDYKIDDTRHTILKTGDNNLLPIQSRSCHKGVKANSSSSL